MFRHQCYFVQIQPGNLISQKFNSCLTDGRTDTPTYRDARTHLITLVKIIQRSWFSSTVHFIIWMKITGCLEYDLNTLNSWDYQLLSSKWGDPCWNHLLPSWLRSTSDEQARASNVVQYNDKGDRNMTRRKIRRISPEAKEFSPRAGIDQFTLATAEKRGRFTWSRSGWPYSIWILIQCEQNLINKICM